MTRLIRNIVAPLCILASTSLFLLACKGSSADAATSAGAAADLSGPPTMNADFAARNPGVCAKVMHPPSAAEAQALVQCSVEGFLPGPSLILVTDVSVEMGGSRPPTPLDQMNDSDPSAKVYPLRGSLTRYACALAKDYPAGANCQHWQAAVGGNAPGRCYKTTFGNWTCVIAGGYSNQFDVKFVAGPTAY